MFLERYIQNPSIAELSYISGKVYSESWHYGTLLNFQERYIQNSGITELSYIPGKVYLEP